MSDLKAKLASQLNKAEAVLAITKDYYDLSPEGSDTSLVPIDAPSNSVQVVPEFAITLTKLRIAL